MRYTVALLFLMSLAPDTGSKVMLPLDSRDRSSLKDLELTKIGAFGIIRKARPTVPTHYHTGIDIKRPGTDYERSIVYPIADGIVISSRDDGPYAQLILEHEGDTAPFWSVYEHIAGIEVSVDEKVSVKTPIARFMNRKELELHGWQFDHLHLEILKRMPKMIVVSSLLPQRRFKSYTLECTTEKKLNKFFYNPITFLDRYL